MGKTPAARALPNGGRRLHLLDVPFAMRASAQAAGAKWDARLSGWAFETGQGQSLPEALKPFASLPYSFERHREDLLNGVVRSPSKPSRVIELRPHQEEGVKQIHRAARIGRVGFLLGDEVGLGKTITAWQAVSTMSGVKRVLIVAPLSVLANWRATISWLGDRGIDVVVINYDRLNRLFGEDAAGSVGKAAAAAAKRTPVKKATKRALARSGKVMEFDVVIADEAHRLKNPDAIRTRFAMRLCSKAKFTLWLSATAGSTPLDLAYAGPLLAQMTGSKMADLKEFEAWCQQQKLGVKRGAFGKWEWSGDRAALEKTRTLLYGGAIPAGLRRLPQEIAGWPEINRILFPIELSTESYALYDAAWREFREAMRLQVRGVRGGEAANGLVARLRFRQKSSLLRVLGTIDHVRELLENGLQVAVNLAFIETMEEMVKALASDRVGISRVYGGQNARDREAERFAFQRGDNRVVFSTVSEGVSFHQGELNDVPRAHVIHDLDYSPIKMAQTEGRCHRDGRFSQIYWAYAASTVEEEIAEIVARRLVGMKAMQGDETEALEEIEALLKARVNS